MMSHHELLSTMIPVEELANVFSDLTPKSQNNSSEERVCVIQYPTAFALAYSYMQAVWECHEMSDRALKLSTTCAKLNPANYTVWHFRRQCLHALGYIQQKEAVQKDLGLASLLGGTNPKNYQIWYHRRALLEAYGVDEFFCESELKYVAQVLEEDAKNYHAWSYRLWILLTFNDEATWKKELMYLEGLIDEDVRNNSAWNGRWFVVHRGTQSMVLDADSAQKEAEFAIEKAALDPYNESPWRYLVSILKEQHKHNDNNPATNKTMVSQCEAKAYEDTRAVLKDNGRDPNACISLNSARFDMLLMIRSKESVEKAVALAETMASEHDTVRAKFWQLQLERARELLAGI